MEKPVRELVRWFCGREQVAGVLLCTFVVVSAVGVVRASHETRSLYRQLQELQQEQDELESEFGKLLLEQSAWADNSRVDQIARKELNMTPPDVEEIVLVKH